MSTLKNHPFAVEAFFESSVVLTFALPKADLQKFLPPCLELDTLHDQWAFLAIAMVQTKRLRPKGFPTWMGNDFFLIGYRIFVRYHTSYGKRLRGLYIIKSETNKKKMEFFGNIFTHYAYTTTDIQQKTENNQLIIRSSQSNFEVTLNRLNQEVPLPAGSPFIDWKEARKFAGPLPFTFTYNPNNKSVLMIEGVRQNWTPKPVHVHHYSFEFLKKLQLEHAVLANAFEINNIPYYWKKGKIDFWKP